MDVDIVETKATVEEEPRERIHLPILERPRTRADCVDGPRPCPWVTCEHHLADVVAKRKARAVAGARLDALAETCALDVASRGPLMLAEIGTILGLTRERVRQIEVVALVKLRRALELRPDLLDGPARRKPPSPQATPRAAGPVPWRPSATPWTPPGRSCSRREGGPSQGEDDEEEVGTDAPQAPGAFRRTPTSCSALGRSGSQRDTPL